MKKRTINGAVKVQRHYATNGILMSREQKKLIEIPEGTLVEVLKARRQTHLCSVRCVEDPETGARTLGTGRKATDTCIAIPVANLPKMKIEGVTEAAGRKKGSKNKKGTKANPLPEVAPEVPPQVPPADQPVGIAQADIQPEPAPAPEAALEVAAPAAEADPAVVEQAPVEAAV